MSTDRFVERYEPLWRELESLLTQARGRGGVHTMTPEELARLDRLYRLTTIHVAQVRSRTQSTVLLQYLNRLVTSAHSVIYAPSERHPIGVVLHFYLTGFARAVVRTGRFHMAALALFLVGAAGGWFVVEMDVGGAYIILGPSEIRLPGSSAEQLETVMRSGRDMGGGMKAAFSSFLFSHNTKVGFMACASGILAGVLTVFLMVMNGATLGAFAAVHISGGVGTEMWAWILPHGITEIGAVILCGGAGLVIATAVVRPGYKPRRQALIEAGRQVAQLAAGVVPLFFAAGLIEGFLRQSELDSASRLTFALASAVFWTLYFYRGARIERASRQAASQITADSVL